MKGDVKIWDEFCTAIQTFFYCIISGCRHLEVKKCNLFCESLHYKNPSVVWLFPPFQPSPENSSSVWRFNSENIDILIHHSALKMGNAKITSNIYYLDDFILHLFYHTWQWKKNQKYQHCTPFIICKNSTKTVLLILI